MAPSAHPAVCCPGPRCGLSQAQVRPGSRASPPAGCCPFRVRPGTRLAAVSAAKQRDTAVLQKTRRPCTSEDATTVCCGRRAASVVCCGRHAATPYAPEDASVVCCGWCAASVVRSRARRVGQIVGGNGGSASFVSSTSHTANRAASAYVAWSACQRLDPVSESPAVLRAVPSHGLSASVHVRSG